MKTKSNMKTKSVVSALCALLGFAALADSYTFTPGTVIPLKENGSQATYVTTSGDMKVSSDVHVDSTKKDGTLTVNLTNSAPGDYVLRMLGTADGYTSVYTLTVTDGSDYTRTVTVNQKNTKADTTLANSNLGASNSTAVNAQPAFLVLDRLPEGGLTLTFKIDSSSGNWAGNYGYFTIYNVASVPVLDVEGSNGNVLTSLSSQDYISTCGTINPESNGVAFGATRHGAVAAFALNVAEKATVTFEYDAGSMKSADTSHKWVLLSNDQSSGVSETFTKTIAQTTDWWGDGVAQHYTLDFGLLPAGYYTLCCYVVNSDTGVWAGNFGNFTFYYTESTDLDISADMTLTESSTLSRKVTISNNPTIDLAGHDLVIDVSAGSSISGTAEITNTSSTLSTLTLKNLTDSTLLKGLQFSGNVKLVIDGWSSNVEFNNNATVAYDSASANSHTGGTTLQNSDNTKTLTIYNQSALGSGTITFNGNAYLKYPDNGNPQSAPTFSNGICVNNAGNKWEGAFGGQSSQVNFNGDWSGDGELWMFNSWQPEIYLNNMSGHGNESFTGTLLLTDNRDFNRGYHIGDYSIGFPCATVCLTNRYVSADFRRMELYLQTRSGIVKFGRLMTDQVKTGEGYTQHTNTCLIANHTGNSPVYIGAKQSASDYDIFSGYFKEQSSMTFSLTKEGEGTLELNGQTESQFSQGITVSAGTLILNTTVSTATAVTVAEGAQFYGTVPASGSVTYQSGAIIDCDTAHTITGNVDLSNVIVAGSNPSEGVFLTVYGTVSGTYPQLSAELKAVRKLGDKNGKWVIDIATADGATTYSLVWQPTGLIIIVR